MKKDSELVALFSVPDIIVHVPTIWLLNNCMRDDFYNAHIIMKYITVENYFNGDSRMWWDIYNDMQFKRVSQKPFIDKSMADHEEAFRKLIKNMKENGFNDNYPIMVNKYLRSVDGSHRLAVALYLKIPYVPIKCVKEVYDIDPEYSLKWFLENGFENQEEAIVKTYKKINSEWNK